MEMSIDYEMREIPDKEGKIQCYTCGGTGYVGYMVSKDDTDIEPCIDCEATGKVYPPDPIERID